MYLVAIAWMYVVLMMAVVEAFSSQGTVLGALITFVFYGVVPLSIVMYVMGAPRRRAARRKAEASESPHDKGEGAVASMPTLMPTSTSTSPSAQSDDGGHAPAAQTVDALVAERKES
ncbi:hypothetical protein [Mitsuaria sp. 7]|uniref:hypothetical protein n=1 Tax=Mitsuaria sp. 7 TaxID=1658665 RepID=UPI0007DD98FF|nr:hypothetical protein [Mitsuaria sp. 7]ANH66368.1 hypothetical protein ABE85_00165 [Mitsuaria sp. 7]